MQTLILYAAFVISYVLLRTQGVEGFNIRINLLPKSVPEKIQIRLRIAVALILMSGSFILAISNETKNKDELAVTIVSSIIATVIIFRPIFEK